MTCPGVASDQSDSVTESWVAEQLARMTLVEKVGQMCQANVGDGPPPGWLVDAVREGRIGAVLNTVDVDTVNDLQRIAAEESRLGIPLLVGRDVIHGFRTVMPIPFAQAASWNPDVVEEGARVAACEAARSGVNWTFAPMIDVSRDPRWGRIAESLGEDPHLSGQLGAAMVRGFQGSDLSEPDAIAACAKHFVGYGAAESGRDYASTNVSPNEMRNVYLRPFLRAVEAGVATLMTSFSDIDGVPASANEALVRDILRGEWKFDGFVVSDWDSIRDLSTHGITANDRESAMEAARAGLDMEMHGDAYGNHLERLVDEGVLDQALIDVAAGNVLRIKHRLGLATRWHTDPGKLPPTGNAAALDTAYRAAVQSVVLLKNENNVLPLSPPEIDTLAVIGPLADAPREQLGTWIFDGDATLSVTPLDAIRSAAKDFFDVNYVRALESTISVSKAEFDAAYEAARSSDAVVLFVGEDAILSGEAHSRADIALPGAQSELVHKIREAGRPIVAVIMTGRPLTLTNIFDQVDAVLFAGHLGTMAGPALADLLFGGESPSGKLPATLPRMVGQVPIYYAQKNTGRPPGAESVVLIDDIASDAEQLSTGMTAYHLDAGFEPLFEFGYGLTYTTFAYENIRVSGEVLRIGESLTVSADITNTGEHAADEIVQLYVRDVVGSITRPVRELRGFLRKRLQPGERTTVEFRVHTNDLRFHGRHGAFATEPGEFHLGIGGSSKAVLSAVVRVLANE